MKITRYKLREIVESYHGVLNRERISTISDLERMLGKKVFTNSSDEFMEFEKRASNAGTFAYTISYVVPGLGIPLELKLNPALDYTKVIIKAEKAVEGFEPFSADCYGNIAQIASYAGIDIRKFLPKV